MTNATRLALRREQVIVGLCALLFAAVIMIPGMNAYSMHLDEVDLVELAEGFNPFDLATYTDELIEFGHPPLWYAMMSGWLPVAGDNDFAMRVPSVLAGILAVAFIYRTGADLSRRSFGGLAAALLFSAMGFVVYLIHQVHNYALFVLLTAMLLFFYQRWWQSPHDKRYTLGVGAATVLLLYLHYYGAYPIIAINLHALFWAVWRRETYKRWFVLQAICALLFVPWLPAFYHLTQSKSNALVAVPSTWKAVRGEMVVLFFHRPWIHGAVMAVGFLTVWRLPGESRRCALWIVFALMIFLVISLASAVLVNHFVRTFFDRRMVFWLVGVALLSGFLLACMPRRIGWVALAAAVVLSATTPQQGVRGNWHIRQTVEWLEANAQSGDAIFYQTSIISTEWLPRPFRYYSEKILGADKPFLVQNLYNVTDSAGRDYFANHVFADLIWTRDRFWVVQTAPDNPVPETTTLEWVEYINGRMFQPVERYEIPLFIVTLFEAIPYERAAMPGAVTVPDRQPLPQMFGETFALVDYQLDRLTVRPGDAIALWLDWQVSRAPDADFALGLYLVKDGVVYGQWDGDPTHLDRPTPTTRWRPGMTLYGSHTLTVLSDAPLGVYALEMALYRRDDLSRLWVMPYANTHLMLAEIEVIGE